VKGEPRIIPPSILETRYVKESLHNENDGFALALANSIVPGTIAGFAGLDVDGQAVAPAQISLITPDGGGLPAEQNPLPFPMEAGIILRVADMMLDPGRHHLALCVAFREVGLLTVFISDEFG
jgi:hypothetical protein